MEQSSSNIYVSLQRLVWSTFVGVISFQIIAPNVWNYVNKMLGIQYQTGYLTFVIIYAVTLPIIILIWLLLNLNELKACLFPIEDEKETNKLCTNFLRGLALTLGLQVIAIIVLLRWYWKDEIAFVVLQLFLTGMSLTLLGIGAVISSERIRLFAKENSDTASVKVKNKAWRILITWIALALSLVLFGSKYWINNSKNYVSESENEVTDSFLILEKRDRLDSLLIEVRANHVAVQYKENNLNIVELSRKKMDAQIQDSLNNVYIDKTLFDLTQLSLLKKDSLKRLDSVYQQIDNLLVARKDLTLKKAQRGLGKRLRDNQLKITYLLLNVFLILISLYVFLKADLLIKEHQYEGTKRLFELYPNAFEFKTEALGKEDKKNNSMRISGDIWLYITIAVWLLVPLFKPIEDAKIDTTAPFKMLTFGNGADRFFGDTSNDKNVRISNSFNNTNSIDSVLIQVQRRFDVDVINTADLSELKSVLDTLDRRTKQIKARADTITNRATKIKNETYDIKKRVRTLVP